MSMPDTARASSLTSPTLRTPSSPPALARRRPWRASSAPRRARARASCARRAAPRPAPARRPSDTLQLGRRRLSRADPASSSGLARRRRRSAPRCGARRRRRRCRRRTVIRPMSPVRRTWVPPQSSTDQPSVLPAPLAHRDDAHLVAVFLAEQRAGARGARVVDAPSAAWSTGEFCSTIVVGDVLDLLELLGGHRLGMREVEAQPVGRDQRALLRDVVAEHLAQRLVQQMRRRMVARGSRCGGRDRPSSASAAPALSAPCSTVP